MRDNRCSAAADGPASRAIGRRTVLAGATGALVGVGLSRSSQGWGRAATPAATPEALADASFDPMLARRLQQALDDAVAASTGRVPGGIVHVARAGHGNWSGAAGFAQLDPDVAMRPDDRFGVGSIVKPFVAATVLQITEDGRF
jgi:CubicO group peptidase (beta-lactamase class C family)